MKTTHLFVFGAVLSLGVFCTPTQTFASSSSPSCTLSVTIDGATTTVDRHDTVLVRAGSVVQLNWKSRNATKMTDSRGRSIELFGSATTTPTSHTSYSYTASKSSYRSTCGVSVDIVSGSVTSPAMASSSKILKMTGKARGVTTFALNVVPFGTTTATMTANTRVRSSSWSYTLPRVLSDGVYLVELSTTKSGVRTVVATSTLTIGNAVPAASTTVVVVPVPLLIGGRAHPGATVAVGYLQLINIGYATATVSSIALTQYGSAPVSSVVGLTSISDNGAAKGAVGDMVTQAPFVGNTVTVPLGLVLAPREMRLVTLKAIATPNIAPVLNTTLTLWVTGVLTDAHLSSKLPLYGTTWTFGY